MRFVLLIAIGAALVVAACDAAPVSSPSPSPSPEQLALLTQPPAPANQACMEALATGRLALNPLSGLGLAQPDGQLLAVSWPNGYSAQLVETTLVLFDHEGNALARLGDPINLGGGFGDGRWYTCHGQLSVAN